MLPDGNIPTPFLLYVIVLVFMFTLYERFSYYATPILYGFSPISTVFVIILLLSAIFIHFRPLPHLTKLKLFPKINTL